VVHTLQEQEIHLDHPLEVIVFTDEENSMVGCRSMAGTLNLKKSATVADLLPKVGGDWNQLAKARRSAADVAAFIELHVEQGGVLEASDKAIGVVEGVVGMYRYVITVTGRPNHAGTTPMHMRQDALVAAAQIVLAVQILALQSPGQPVATVGSLNVTPNASNIVPGQVELTVDLRDLSQTCIDNMETHLKKQIEAIAAATKTQIEIKPILQMYPTPAAQTIQSVVAQVADQLGLSHMLLPSRAGHDAMEIGRFTDMGMIFVPSQGGISHSGDEYTTPEQCIQGANVLLQTLLQLDALYPIDLQST
jgi:N-carbamoyl-L-amino-acid hydrolase